MSTKTVHYPKVTGDPSTWREQHERSYAAQDRAIEALRECEPKHAVATIAQALSELAELGQDFGAFQSPTFTHRAIKHAARELGKVS